MDWVWDSNNYKWLCTTYSLEHFISSVADKTNAHTQQYEQYFYFSLTLKDTEIFPKLLFWSDSWVTAPVFHNRFLVINLYLMTVVIHTKQRMWENRERERETTLLQWKLSRTQLYFIPRMFQITFLRCRCCKLSGKFAHPQTPRFKRELANPTPPPPTLHTHTHPPTHPFYHLLSNIYSNAWKKEKTKTAKSKYSRT